MAKADRSGNTSTNYTKKIDYIKQATHKAILFSIVDLGTQLVKSQAHGDKNVRRWRITRELTAIANPDAEGQKAVVSQEYTQSMYNSQLLKLVESMKNVKLTDKEAKDFDIETLLGMGCRLQLVHNGEYVNINGIMSLDEGEKLGKPSYDIEFYDIDAHDQKVFDKLPKFVQDKIVGCDEYKAMIEKQDEKEVDDLPFN